MFDNISKLRFEQGPNQEPLANAMISSEGEMMEYRQGIVAEGKVEDWMTLVLNEMRRTNRLLTKESIFHYCETKTRYMDGLCCQALLRGRRQGGWFVLPGSLDREMTGWMVCAAGYLGSGVPVRESVFHKDSALSFHMNVCSE
jgi:hypothetical protein